MVVPRLVSAGEIELRAARRSEVPAIVRLLADDLLGQLREDVGAGETIDDSYWRAFDAISADPRQLLVVAVRAGEVVGTLQLSFIPYLTFKGGERAQIKGVRVAAPERGNGVGRRMIDWSITEARMRGCHLVQLTTSRERHRARHFYGSLGFAVTHDGMKLEL